jgi:hypothetical protein
MAVWTWSDITCVERQKRSGFKGNSLVNWLLEERKRET